MSLAMNLNEEGTMEEEELMGDELVWDFSAYSLN